MSIRGVVWSLCFGLMMIPPAFSKDETVVINFDGLVKFAIKQSPVVRIIEQTYGLTETERNMDLQWTNPEFNYSQEDAGGQMEQYLTLSKQIEMPWVYTRRRKSWEAQLESAEYKNEDQIRRFISDLKSGYIELKLLGTQLEHLNRLKDMIVNVSDVAQDQLIEGTLSGVDQYLIQMTLVNINARLQLIERTKQSVKSRWKADMGISASAQLQLLTDIHFQPVELESIDHYQSLIPNTPGYRQRQMKKVAIQSRIQMERRSVIPRFSLFGGLKKLEQDRDGYLAGISIPLPVFNQNRSVIQKQRIELKITDSEFERYQQILQGQIKTLVLTIQNLGAALKMAETYFNEDQNMIDSIQTSYQEGWMSLTEMLNAIQIQTDGIQQFYNQLTDYYRSLFQLEAITGQTLVTLSAQEGDKQ